MPCRTGRKTRTTPVEDDLQARQLIPRVPAGCRSRTNMPRRSGKRMKNEAEQLREKLAALKGRFSFPERLKPESPKAVLMPDGDQQGQKQRSLGRGPFRLKKKVPAWVNAGALGVPCPSSGRESFSGLRRACFSAEGARGFAPSWTGADR